MQHTYLEISGWLFSVLATHLFILGLTSFTYQVVSKNESPLKNGMADYRVP
jgi:hypothetical protein